MYDAKQTAMQNYAREEYRVYEGKSCYPDVDKIIGWVYHWGEEIRGGHNVKRGLYLLLESFFITKHSFYPDSLLWKRSKDLVNMNLFQTWTSLWSWKKTLLLNQYWAKQEANLRNFIERRTSFISSMYQCEKEIKKRQLIIINNLRQYLQRRGSLPFPNKFWINEKYCQGWTWATANRQRVI